MSCNKRRWANHALSAPSKLPESGASKEMNDRLAQMQQERMRQDAMWEDPPATLVTQITQPPSNNNSAPKQSLPTNLLK
jgi:hypothetical protein